MSLACVESKIVYWVWNIPECQCQYRSGWWPRNVRRQVNNTYGTDKLSIYAPVFHDGFQQLWYLNVEKW